MIDVPVGEQNHFDLQLLFRGQREQVTAIRAGVERYREAGFAAPDQIGIHQNVVVMS